MRVADRVRCHSHCDAGILACGNRFRRIAEGSCRTVILLCVLSVAAIGQSEPDTTFKLIVSVGGGMSRDLGASDTQTLGSEYQAGGFGGSLRLAWHPDHILMAGIETGYFRISMLTLSSDTTADRSVSLNAVPILVVFAMKKYGIEISGGLGWYRYFVIAELQRSGIRGGSYSYEIGYMLSLGYAYPLSRRFEVGLEAKMHSIPDRKITLLLAQAKVSWRLFEY